jgi:hypothetical protein
MAWTGFASIAQNGGANYILLFRELNPSADWLLDLKLFNYKINGVTVLAGEGKATFSGNQLTAHIPGKLQYLWLRLD